MGCRLQVAVPRARAKGLAQALESKSELRVGLRPTPQAASLRSPARHEPPLPHLLENAGAAPPPPRRRSASASHVWLAGTGARLKLAIETKPWARDWLGTAWKLRQDKPGDGGRDVGRPY